jgi:hypothetical protein
MRYMHLPLGSNDKADVMLSSNCCNSVRRLSFHKMRVRTCLIRVSSSLESLVGDEDIVAAKIMDRWKRD